MGRISVFPLPGGTYRKSSGYGYRRHPVTGARGSFHGGVDYAASAGTPIYAPFNGHVTAGYENGGAGNWLWVDSGGLRFKSFHHSRNLVTSGFVRRGDVIAHVGTTGSSTGPHAHLELWVNGSRIDPTADLDAAPLRDASSPVSERRVLRLLDPPMRGDDVRQLQALFGSMGLESTVDGVWGPATNHVAVEAQRRLGLVPDGVWGPASWGAVDNLFNFLAAESARKADDDLRAIDAHFRFLLSQTPTELVLGPGASGDLVSAAQWRLKARGHDVTVDGQLGPATSAALRAFQESLRRMFPDVSVDGLLGPQTRFFLAA